MRGLFAILTIACAARIASAEARGSGETLVGWSDDGTRYAVIGFTTDGAGGKPEFFLEVREGTKVAFRWVEPAGADAQTPDKIDVETWEPVKKFALKKLDGPAAQKRFAAKLVAATTGKADDRYDCGPGGWSVKKRNGAVLREVKASQRHCFRVMGGYVNKAGTHSLVKVREGWQVSNAAGAGDRTIYEYSRFVLVAL